MKKLTFNCLNVCCVARLSIDNISGKSCIRVVGSESLGPGPAYLDIPHV